MCLERLPHLLGAPGTSWWELMLNGDGETAQLLKQLLFWRWKFPRLPREWPNLLQWKHKLGVGWTSNLRVLKHKSGLQTDVESHEQFSKNYLNNIHQRWSNPMCQARPGTNIGDYRRKFQRTYLSTSLFGVCEGFLLKSVDSDQTPNPRFPLNFKIRHVFMRLV